MKLMKIMLAVLVMVAMVVPAIAEDRLDLSGSMQVRGFLYDYDFDETFFGEKENDSDDGRWNDQRLRIAGKFNVADGVKVIFRFDATESDENSSNAVAWGGSTQSAYQYSQRRADIQFDQAYIQLVKNGFTFEAGQKYFGGFGYTRKMLDVVGAGFSANYKGFTLHHVKRMDENNGNNSFNKVDGRDEISLTALKYDFKGDGFSLSPMLAYNADARDDEDTFDSYELFGAALSGMIDLGPVALKGELDYFNGDDNDNDIDLKGLQIYLDGSMAATDTLRIGGILLYAQGQDDDTQVTNMNFDGTVDWTFAEWHPEQYGYWAGDFVVEIDTFDPTGFGAGVIGAEIYADLKVNENIDMKFAGMYWQEEDDTFVEGDGYSLNAGLSYKIMDNTVLNTQVNYMDFDIEDSFNGDIYAFDGDVLQVISGLIVKF